MKNIITKGSELEIPNVELVFNEDHALVGKITNVAGTTITFEKIWDSNTPKKQYTANLYYNGKTEVVGSGAPVVGQWMKFFRKPDGWVGLVNKYETTVIADQYFAFVSKDNQQWSIGTQSNYIIGQGPFRFLSALNYSKPRRNYASSWTIGFYSTYNDVDKTYSGLIYEIPTSRTCMDASPYVDEYYDLYIKNWGNYNVPSKLSLYPTGAHPYNYTPPYNLNYYVKVTENHGSDLVSIATGGSATSLYDTTKNFYSLVSKGDKITIQFPNPAQNRTETITNVYSTFVTFASGLPILAGYPYTIFFPTRYCVPRTLSSKARVYVPWGLKKTHQLYDPITDTWVAYPSPYWGCEGASNEGISEVGIPMRYAGGFNDEVNIYFIAKLLQEKGVGSWLSYSQPIPIFPSISGIAYFAGTINWKSNYEYKGGKLYLSVNPADWQVLKPPTYTSWGPAEKNDTVSNLSLYESEWLGESRNIGINGTIILNPTGL